MKRIPWLLVKFAFILVSLVFIYGYNLHKVSAEGCDTGLNCFSQNSLCQCIDGNCGGCFIPRGQAGCGKCSGGGELELQ